jgi:hypothetical protein
MLEQFDVLGEGEAGDDGEEVRPGDPRRSLVRYTPDREVYVSTRLNPDLWKAALSLPVVLVMPIPRAGEVLERNGLLTPGGSVANFEFRDTLGEVLDSIACPASYLADVHGGGRRSFYFAAESAERFGVALSEASDRAAMEVDVQVLSFAEAALFVLPIEWIGRLGLAVPPKENARKTRFSFWGAEDSLARLRTELERADYSFSSLEMATRELRMTKVVPLDAAGFLAELRRIVPLSRSLRCSYRGEEAVDPEQFLLTSPAPEYYYPAKRSFLDRLLGRKAG